MEVFVELGTDHCGRGGAGGAGGGKSGHDGCPLVVPHCILQRCHPGHLGPAVRGQQGETPIGPCRSVEHEDVGVVLESVGHIFVHPETSDGGPQVYLPKGKWILIRKELFHNNLYHN